MLPPSYLSSLVGTACHTTEQTVLKLLLQFQTDANLDDASEVGGITRGKVRRYAPDEDVNGAIQSGPAAPQLSIHVSPAAAVALAHGLHHIHIPAALRALIAGSKVEWRPRMPIGLPCFKEKGPGKDANRRAEAAAVGACVRACCCDCWGFIIYPPLLPPPLPPPPHALGLAKVAAAGEPRSGPDSLFKYCELFAGIGGFRVGVDAVGGEAVFASEIDEQSRCTYASNFGQIPSGDITEYAAAQIPAFDMLCVCLFQSLPVVAVGSTNACVVFGRLYEDGIE